MLVVGAVVLAVHWPVLSAQALSLDDDQYLTDNLLVQQPSWASARRFLTEVLEPSHMEGYYQPLTMISLMVDYALGGRSDNVRQFHRSSLALHVMNTALMIVLLYLLFSQVWLAAGVGLLFGVHPLNIEAIAWVAERTTVLGSFFALLCLIFYVRYAAKKNWKLYVASVVMYMLALMSKPTSLPVPLIMLLMDYWPLRRAKRSDNNRVFSLFARAVWEKLPFFALAGTFAFITFVSRGRLADSPLIMPTEYGFLKIPLVICHNIIFYLDKIVWPINLSPLYPFPRPLSISEPTILAGVIGTAVLIVLLVVSLRWTSAILTGWLIFFVALGPTMQIIGFSKAIAGDKYVYLPSVGLLMILMWILGRFCGFGKPAKRQILVVMVLLLLSFGGSVATRRYLLHWRDTLGLYKYMLTLTPKSALVHNNLGTEYDQLGELDKAVEHLRKSIEYKPNYADAHGNLGSVLASLGKVDEAMSHFRHALKIKPNDAESHYNLGLALSEQGKFEQAISHYYEALRLKPIFYEACNNLGTALATLGRLDEGIKQFYRALEINPNVAEAYNNLGKALNMQGKFDEAIDHYRHALQIQPDYANAHNNLGNILDSQGKTGQAIDHYRQAVELEPGHIDAHYNLALALKKTGQLDEAFKEFQAAARLNPTSGKPLACIAHMLATHPEPHKRNLSQAIRLAEHACELSAYQDLPILNTLAMAYAEAAQYDQAIAVTQKMLDIATAMRADGLIQHLRKQLEHYKKQKVTIQP